MIEYHRVYHTLTSCWIGLGCFYYNFTQLHDTEIDDDAYTTSSNKSHSCDRRPHHHDNEKSRDQSSTTSRTLRQSLRYSNARSARHIQVVVSFSSRDETITTLPSRPLPPVFPSGSARLGAAIRTKDEARKLSRLIRQLRDEHLSS